AGGEAAWLERVGKLQHKDIARWSETLAFVCLRSPDPQPPLVALRDRSAAAARRAVVEIETLPPSEGLAFLLETEGCDGEDVVRLVEGWRARGLPVEGLIDVLREQVAPARPTPHLSWIHAGLSLLGPVDSEQFFTQCERPRPAQDDTDYVAVPAGTFVMGSPEDEPERLNSEGPQHRVRVGALWLARTAVTNAQYARFAPDHKRRAWAGIPKAELARHPVVAVSWWEACLYCAWLGARLPSEAEWEYACRAGSTTPFSTGTQLSTDEANYDGNYPYTDGAKGEYRERTVPVGSMPPNAWGLHEVHGNVREWCQDTWHDSYEGAPADGSPWESDGSVLRVVRGGSWFFDAGWCRSAVRDRRRAGGRVDYVGFRPARASRP
ncbi:MAG: SUMF1/EgtB/PvdO family nonheme iron enzyme, partial [Planctomycetota bacterium]